jgi:hypothetical protein
VSYRLVRLHCEDDMIINLSNDYFEGYAAIVS